MDNPNTIVFYIIFFAVLAVLLPFVGHLGRIFPKFNDRQNFISAKIYAICAIIGIILTVSISVFHKYLHMVDFVLFAIIAFVFPLILGPIVFAPFYLTQQSEENEKKLMGREIDNRDFAELVVIYAAFAVIASNFHDILWCGGATDWYTRTDSLGFELKPWVDIVGANTYSYAFFGFYMLLHVIFCSVLAFLMFWRYTKRHGAKMLHNPYSRRAFILAWCGSLMWGYGLFIMDSIGRHHVIWWFISTLVWIPLGIIILGYSGKFLSQFEQNLSNVSSMIV